MILVEDEVDADDVLVVVLAGAVALVSVVGLATEEDAAEVEALVDVDELVELDLLDPPQPASASAASARRMGHRLTRPG